uniref:Uncharacterized protein n=1 Tax=Anopheles minimus TaxID=112268 RepID=A0A182WMS7_9DIPT
MKGAAQQSTVLAINASSINSSIHQSNNIFNLSSFKKVHQTTNTINPFDVSKNVHSILTSEDFKMNFIECF